MIYLDNAATTKPCPSAKDAAVKAMENFGNPSSLHGMGIAAEKTVEESRAAVAELMGVDKKNIYFTSGGTESNNTAIFGAAQGMKKQGMHIITSETEHPSVLEAFKKLENDGFRVSYIKSLESGVIDMDMLSSKLCSDTVLVSIMHINNETGVIQPVDKIKALMREKAPKALFHCDCVQSFGKIDVRPLKWGADMISVSAHKIHGIKGTGALYVNSTKVKPLLYGGEQQKKMRPGTENVIGIAAFGAAVKECRVNSPHMTNLRERMIKKLFDSVDNIRINGEYNNAGSVLNVSFLGIRSEILLHSLERHGIYVSTGSACSSHSGGGSHVLKAMGLDKKEVDSAIRFSFSEYVTEEETDRAVEIIADEVKTLRKYIR